MIHAFKAYVYSDYTIDNHYQGFLPWGYETKTELALHHQGRLISLIDITSQAVKIGFGTVDAVFKSMAAVLGCLNHLRLAAGFGIATLVSSELRKTNRQFTKIHLRASLRCALTPLPTLILGIPLSLLFRVFMVVANTLGLFFPEIGRWARNMNKLINGVLASAIPLPSRQTPPSADTTYKNRVFQATVDKIAGEQKVYPDATHTRRTRAAPPFYPHTRSSMGSDIGRLTALQALRVLGLQSGANLSQINRAAHQLYRRYHPDKGGDQNRFTETRNAHEFLRGELERMQRAEAATSRRANPQRWSAAHAASSEDPGRVMITLGGSAE